MKLDRKSHGARRAPEQGLALQLVEVYGRRKRIGSYWVVRIDEVEHFPTAVLVPVLKN